MLMMMMMMMMVHFFEQLRRRLECLAGGQSTAHTEPVFHHRPVHHRGVLCIFASAGAYWIWLLQWRNLFVAFQTEYTFFYCFESNVHTIVCVCVCLEWPSWIVHHTKRSPFHSRSTCRPPAPYCAASLNCLLFLAFFSPVWTCVCLCDPQLPIEGAQIGPSTWGGKSRWTENRACRPNSLTISWR